MPHFEVMIEFSIVHALCDPTDPNGTPEQIGAQGENLIVELVEEHQGIRTYHALLTVEAACKDSLGEHLVGLFSHLPEYKTIEVSIAEGKPEPKLDPVAQQHQAAAESGSDEPVLSPADKVDLEPFRLQCYFKSAVPFEVLRDGFVKHIAVGNLVSNATIGGEFVAFVSLNAISEDGLEDVVETLLRKAFNADTEESALNFRPITTKLI